MRRPLQAIGAVHLCLLSAFMPSTSRAAPEVVVVAAGLDLESRKVAGLLEYTAEQALSRSGRFELLRLVDALDPKAAAERQSHARAGQEAIEAGFRAYEELDTQAASTHFTKAMAELRKADLTRTFAAFSKAWVMRIACQYANGETRVAQAELEKLLKLDPRAVFSADFFSPDTLKHVEAARRAAIKGGTVSIEVSTSPTGAQVYLNGQFRGVSPLKLERLAAAEHLLTVTAPGRSLLQQAARPGTNELALLPAEAAVAFEASLQRLLQQSKGAARDQAARELGRLLGVEQVVIALANRRETGAPLQLDAVRLNVSDGRRLAAQEAQLPSGEELVASDAVFSALFAADLPVATATPVKSEVKAPKGQGKLLGYSLLGTGAALFIGGVLLGLQAGSANSEYRATPQVDPRSPALRNTAQTYALVADVTLISGLLAAGTGGYLTFLRAPQSASGQATPKSPPAPAPSTETKPPKKDDHDLRDD